MILYFYGEDTFSSKEVLNDSIRKFKAQRDPKGYNVIVLDGKKVAASKIVAEINTAPFLAEKRLVAIENILSSSDKEMLAEIIERVEKKKFPENNIIIFWQGEPLSKVKEAKELHELLAKEKYAKHHEKLVGVRLIQWIEEKVKEVGGTIEKNAAQKLAENGGDLWSISNKIKQLVSFANGNIINNAHVEEFIDEKLDDNIFNLTDAVVAGNHKKALSLLEQQRKLGEEDGKLFGTILWQFRILVEMSDLVEREGEMPSEMLAKKIGIHPFVAKKNLAVIRGYSLARLEKIYHELLEIDIKTKTGRADQSLLLDLFVAKI